MKKLVVFHKGEPLVIIEPPKYEVITNVLNWYAKEYGFYRQNLKGAYLDTIVCVSVNSTKE